MNTFFAEQCLMLAWFELIHEQHRKFLRGDGGNHLLAEKVRFQSEHFSQTLIFTGAAGVQLSIVFCLCGARVNCLSCKVRFGMAGNQMGHLRGYTNF